MHVSLELRRLVVHLDAPAYFGGVDVGDCEGVQVVCTPDCETVITVYRNSDFRGLKPRSNRRSH